MTSPREALDRPLECEQASIRLEARVARRLVEMALTAHYYDDYSLRSAADTLDGVIDRLAKPLDGPPEELCGCESCTAWRREAHGG